MAMRQGPLACRYSVVCLKRQIETGANGGGLAGPQRQLCFWVVGAFKCWGMRPHAQP